jgi:hypothetical protein
VLPASWPSKSCKQDDRSKGGICEVGVETGDWRSPSARLCLAAFVEPRSALHARPEGTAKHNTCEMHMSTCTRVQAPGCRPGGLDVFCAFL